MQREKYDNLNGLRTYAAIGIILMHVLTNGKYQLQGYLFDRIIPSFTDFVYLFMVISGFAMCCGYLEKMKNCQISLEEFYKKRYAKILPFFATLIILDILISPSVNSIYEAFTSLTLCFGLLPNANHTVIGVSWTLGVIFVFYLLFPFFSFLMANRKRAWFTFVVSIAYNFVCKNYYFNEEHMLSDYIDRTGFVFCAVYFVSGAIVYLYRKEIENSNCLIWLGISCLMIIVYYNIPSTLVNVGFSVALLGYAISKKKSRILNNRFTKFISQISMEVYLCHMVIYRLLEKGNWIHIFQNHFLSYVTTSLMTVIGAIIFSFLLNLGISKLKGRIYA